MNQRGITLAELLVSMFVMSVIGIVVYNVYLVAGNFISNEQLRIEVDLSASRILTVMDNNLRQAKRAYVSHDFNGTPYPTSSSVLVFGLPSIVSGAPSLDKIDYAVYYVENGILKLQLDPDPSSSRSAGVTDVTQNVKDIYFRYNNTTITSITAVTVTLATRKSVLGKPYTQYAILNETFRNHP